MLDLHYGSATLLRCGDVLTDENDAPIAAVVEIDRMHAATTTVHVYLANDTQLSLDESDYVGWLRETV